MMSANGTGIFLKWLFLEKNEIYAVAEALLLLFVQF